MSAVAVARRVVGVLVCGLLAVALATQGRPTKPHIVFFLADDYGFADISYHTEMYGNASNVVKTPALDALAASGVKLENYYVQPVCSPTRATLLTGRYVTHHGIRAPFGASSPSVLHLNETTMAQKMQEAGYATHAVGKWHLGFRSPAYLPQNRGFDSFFGYYSGSQDYYNHYSLCWPAGVPNGCFENTTKHGDAVTGLDLHRNDDVVFNKEEYSTILYSNEAEAVIHRHMASEPHKPLFLYLPHQAVHVGNTPEKDHPEYALDQAPQEYIDEYSWVQNEQRRNLSAMITVMDDAAANVTKALKTVGIWQDTIFIFSTDNGGPTGDQASNYPLKEGKGTLWEGGVRGIGFVTSGDNDHWGIQSGTVNHELLHVSDWFPSLCEIAGCSLNGTLPLDGVAAWGSITKGKPSPREEIVHDICWSHFGGSCTKANRAAYRKGKHKLIMLNGADGKAELYDIEADPSETKDIADSFPQVVAQMKATVAEYAKTTMPACDRDPPDPRSNPLLHNGTWVPWLP
eukprot:m.483220 g.483220  ORF g.483220 m.483220 type:complete len:516 (-) comp22829_c0_seq1:60-1607(-)